MALLSLRSLIALVFLSMSGDCCSVLEKEQVASLIVNQMTLREQSSALTQQCQAMSQLLASREESHLNTQREPQVIAEMAQVIQQSLNRSLTNVAEEVGALRLQYESLHEALQALLQKVESMTPRTEETSQISPQVTTEGQLLENQYEESSQAPPPGFTKVSDGWFLLVKEDKDWDNARIHCIGMGAELAIPPTDLDAFKTFLDENTSGYNNFVWLGGKRKEDQWEYLNGSHVDYGIWYSGFPNTSDNCLAMYGRYTPPIVSNQCSFERYFLCRY